MGPRHPRPPRRGTRTGRTPLRARRHRARLLGGPGRLGRAGQSGANPAVESDLLAERAEQIQARLDELEDDIARTGDALQVAAAGRYPGAPEVRVLAGEEARLLAMRREQTRLRDEAASMGSDASDAAADPHAHLTHRNTPIESATGTRARLLSWWAVLSTPLILWMLGQIVHPAVGVSATAFAVWALVVLVSIEGFVRGKFLAVMGRFLLILLAVVAAYFLWRDWRVVVGAALGLSAITILVANLREAFRR